MGAISGSVSRPSSGEDESKWSPGTSQFLRACPAGSRRGRPHRVRLDGLALPGIWWAPMSASTRGRGPSRGARRRERATAAKAPAATPVTLTPRTWRLVELLLLATLAILALYAASQDVTGEDLWWHLATGRYILEHGEIPTRDVFSFTYAGAPWFNQEWLAQVLFFDLFRRGGGTALVAFKVLVAASLFPAAAWLGWRRSGSWLLSAGPAIAAAFVCRPFLDIRPQLFSFVGLLAVVAIVDAHRRGAHATLLALLPPTMALWSNLHASFILSGAPIVPLVPGGGPTRSDCRAMWEVVKPTNHGACAHDTRLDYLLPPRSVGYVKKDRPGGR